MPQRSSQRRPGEALADADAAIALTGGLPPRPLLHLVLNPEDVVLDMLDRAVAADTSFRTLIDRFHDYTSAPYNRTHTFDRERKLN